MGRRRILFPAALNVVFLFGKERTPQRRGRRRWWWWSLERVGEAGSKERPALPAHYVRAREALLLMASHFVSKGVFKIREKKEIQKKTSRRRRPKERERERERDALFADRDLFGDAVFYSPARESVGEKLGKLTLFLSIDMTTRNTAWDIVTDHPEIFDTHVVPKLNRNDVKFFYDVNRESRAAIQRSGARVRDTFRIKDFDTKSTLSWAVEKCTEKKERFCAQMAENGNVEFLTFLHENVGCPWDEETCRKAAISGHLECLKYARENGCPWNTETCEGAAYNGHLECLKYAHEKGCPWDESTCSWAAQYGQLECLKYAHEKGCPWDRWACESAAQYGHLECLKYLHENGCPWDRDTCISAALEHEMECLQYMYEKGCPDSEEIISDMLENDQFIL